MSSQKDKYLASAQKYIQKGQFDRALRDYEQVVTADPKDVKHRQKLAELLVRCNRREDAIREYDTIARYYEENGFNLKSIAVYKQIQRLDPSNIEISLSLAALNEKQGMIGNALSEYKTVFEYYEKSGRADDALKILEKMQRVDPDNVDIRLKLAETLCAAGAGDKAYQEYTRAALALKERGMTTRFEKVCGRIQELFPDKKDSSLDILAEQVRNGVVDDAIPKLCGLLHNDPENPAALGLLAEAYRISGDVEKRKGILRQMLGVSPGDLPAIKSLIECSVGEGDVEGSLALIDEYSTALFSAGAYGEIETYYTTLQNSDPYDIRLLDGLKKLYELTGEKSKLADVQVSLTIISQKGKEALASSREEYVELETEPALTSSGEEKSVSADSAWGDEIDLSGAADVGAAVSVDDVSASADSVWGDEIDLTNEVENAPGAQGESRDVATQDFAVIDLSPGEIDSGESIPDEFEIDISFELPEDAEIFASPQADDGKGMFSETAIQSGTPLQDMAEIGDPGTDPGFLEEITLDAEIAPEREPDMDAVPFLVEIAPEVPEQAPAFSPNLPEAEILSSPGIEDSSCAPDVIGAEDILFGLKEDLDQQLDQDDAETHYNLGIAYMEMGLHDDAIKQFRIAANDPNRELDCLTLQGVCCREKADFSEAERILASILSLTNLRADRVLNVRYELGLLYMSAHRTEDALQAFRDVFAVNPGFRETMAMIAELSGKSGTFDLSDVDDVEIELEEID